MNWWIIIGAFALGVIAGLIAGVTWVNIAVANAIGRRLG